MNKQKQREQLLQLRSELIGVLHTHPSSIYPDETIEALLEAQPKSIEELVKVKGFPARGKRVRAFGHLVVAIFNPANSVPVVNKNSKTMDAFGTAQSKVEGANRSAQKTIRSLAVASVVGTASLFNLIHPVRVFADNQSVAVLRNAEKYRYMVASKEEAKKNWQVEQKELFQKKISKEASEEKAKEEAFAAAEERKERMKKTAVGKVKTGVKKAQKASMRVAKDAEAYYRKLEKAARKKREEASAASVSVGAASDKALSDYTSFPVGSEGNSAMKSWMSYLDSAGVDSIFKKSSAQYALQQRAYTGNWGIRMVDGRYCIAVASSFADTIGTKIDVVLASGKVIKCIMGDQKADADTDSLNRYHLSDGSYVEFIVSKSEIDEAVRTTGSFNCIDDFEGPVVEIRVQN